MVKQMWTRVLDWIFDIRVRARMRKDDKRYGTLKTYTVLTVRTKKSDEA